MATDSKADKSKTNIEADKSKKNANSEEKKEPSKSDMFHWLERYIEAKKRALTLDQPHGLATDQLLEELHKLKEIKSLFTTYIVNRIARTLFFSILVLAAIIPLLFWFRLGTTSIELNLITSAVGFTTMKGAGLQPFIENLEFESIGFSELSAVEIASQRPVDMTSFRLSLQPDTDSYVTLEKFIVPGESVVYLSTSDDAEAGSYEAAITVCEGLEGSEVVSPRTCDTDLALELEVGFGSDKENIQISQSIKEQLEEGSLVVQPAPYRDIAKLLRFHFSPRTSPAEETRINLAEQLQISSLNFMRLDELSDSQRARGGLVSGIELGEIYYQDLGELAATEEDDRAKRFLRPGEYLRFTDATGILRTVVLEDSLIHVQFRGTVRGMKTGSYSLMPTYIEWLRSKNSFTAIAASVITLFVGLVPLGMWWLDRRLGKV